MQSGLGNDPMVSALESGRKTWNDWRDKSGKTTFLFHGNVLEGLDFSGCNFVGVEFYKCDFNKCTFGDIPRMMFRDCHLNECALKGINGAKAVFESATLYCCDFSNSNFPGSNFNRAAFTKCEFVQVNLQGAEFNFASLNSANLSCVNFERAPCVNANFSSATLQNVNLKGCDLSQVNLTQVSFTRVSVNGDTKMVGATVDGLIIDRLTLESLHDYGGLAKEDVYKMVVRDDLGALRRAYSGIAQWIHALSLILFIFPYASFILHQWFRAQRGQLSASDAISLGNAVMKYIVSGGSSWGPEWQWAKVPFTAFVVGLVYNVIRGVLLWKTKMLEFEQDIRNLPSNFNFSEHKAWYHLFRISRVFFYVNMAAVLVHTWHFLSIGIPPNP